MGSIHEDDPFLWDTETLSKEICSQNTPWIKNPAALAAKLVDQDIDGHTLLTYELLFSRAELMECLNMTTARSKAGLAETILNFQARSKSFRPWKKNFSKNQSMLLSDDEQHDLKAELSTIPPLKRHLDPAPTPNTHSISAQHEPQGIAEAPLENDQITQAFDDTLLETDGDYPMQLNGDADFATSVDFANGLPSINPQDSPNTPTNARVGKEKSCQRRRLGVKLPLEYSPPLEYSYLGSKGLCRQTILSSTIDAPDHPCMNLGRGGFAVLSPNHAKPPGQRLVVNRILQKQFLKNSRKEATMKRGFIPLQSPAPSNKSASVIDFDDLPDSWDEETQREIDEEKAEVAARKRKLARYLSRERVEAILKDEIAAMEAKWRETNQPRVRHEIYKKWMDAKRNGRMKSLILATLKSAQSYDKHFKKLYTEILLLNWEKESDVRFQAVSLEQTLRNRLEETRHVELFERHDPPPKPLGVLKPKSSAKKAPLDYSDEEILTSSDEEEFVIIDNDPDMTMTDLDVTMTDEDFFKSAPEPPLQRHDREASHPLSEIDASMVIDLTQVESLVEPQVRKATIECIDLTISPIKKKLDEAPPLVKDEPIDLIGEVPPMDQLGSLEKIGETPVKHWTKAKDRWRLVLCLLWKFIQARREPILQLMQENAAEDAWRLSIGSYQVNPFTKESEIGEDPAKTTAFDLTKLFLSCSQCRQYTDDRVVALNKKDKNRLSRAKAFFPAFHAFIREWAPEYPQSSQIYRTDAFDDEIGLDDLDEHSANVIESPSKPRKRVVKEIVQDKAGLKLREQGKKRAEEYEARATKNLNLATLSTTMTEREARLIINESKQDDQPFIYISSTIGDRIKDHQIKGVRFLWNQIILDSDLRQGCLLAHTMGLGKTMQVITLLVAIAEAANSDDESIKAQIPIDLRRSQSLIICPAGLVNNWLDEIKAWSPEDLLGNVFMVESAQAKREQISTIEDWGQYGGVLVIGHEMFKRMRSVNDNIKQILTNKANMVICDEAHMMKNPDSQLHQVLQDFHTKRRIALTGSPLSNSVNEYYSMINWVAPGYLGPKKEFTDIYTDPIEKGLHSESERSDKRKALKRLEALKMTVTPKVQRATVQAVKHELPPKYEFVIFVKPTPLQERLYGIYLNEMVATSSKTTVFNLVQKLGIICNHPRCFRQQMLNQKAALAITTPKAAPQPISGTGVEEAGDESEGPDRPTKFSLNMISTVLKETNGKDIANPELSQKVALLLVVLDQSRAVGDKVIVFSESIHTLNYLEELFKQQRRAVQRLDGSTPVSKRQGMVKAFNAGKAGESEVYLISTRAGGVGLNIQGANRVVIFDFKWNPVNEQQAVGRSYRFGQEKTVYVYRFVIAGSFEEVLQNRSVFKTQLASSVIDKKNPIAWGKRNGDLFKPLWTKPATDLSPFLGRDKILDKLIEQSRTSGAIRQILSTDTFEEEDPTNELTAEEKRDAQELHDMERLKQADPGKYRKLWEEKQRIEQIRAMAATAPRSLGAQIPSTYSSPYSAQPQSNQQASVIPGISFHPAPSANTPSLSQAQSAPIVPTTSRAHFPSSAPLPITGANTYIRNPAAFTNPSENTNAIIPIRSSSTPEQGPESRPRPPDPSSASMLALTPRNFHAINTPSQTTSLFSQPRTQDKMDFEKVLASLISGQLGYTGNGTELAEKITVGVADALKEQAMGFVPDNLRWRLLLNLVREHHRFVLAIMWGNCSPVYLATAPDKEIHNRVSLMNSQPQDDFDAQLRRSASAPDPSNLHSNINRPWAQSARANEDAEAMRQTVHNRTERGFRLPPWANNALSKSNSQTQ